MRNFVQNLFRIDTKIMRNFVQNKVISCKTTELLRKRNPKPPISHEDVSYNSSILMLLNLFAFLLRLKQKFKFLADLQFYFTVFKNMLNIEKIRDKFL